MRVHVGAADERLVAAAAFGAAGRACDILGNLFEVFAREVDDLRDRFHHFGIVVVFIDPLAFGDLVDVVKARRLFVVLDREMLFVDLDLVDVLDRARIEQFGVGGLAGAAREVPQGGEVDCLHFIAGSPTRAGAAFGVAEKSLYAYGNWR